MVEEVWLFQTEERTSAKASEPIVFRGTATEPGRAGAASVRGWGRGGKTGEVMER